MEMLYKLLSSRLDLLSEALSLSEAIIRSENPTQWVNQRREVQSMRKHEKAIQIHEEENMQIIAGKKDYTKQDRLKFHKNMLEAIARLCPQISQQNLKKYPSDGKHRSICMIFIIFFNHLAMQDKVAEIRTIYESKLYKTVPILYLLIKWYISVSRKMIQNQFKFFNQQMKLVVHRILCVQLHEKYEKMNEKQQLCSPGRSISQFGSHSQHTSLMISTSSCILHKAKDSESLINDKTTQFKKHFKLVKQVIPDASLEEIPQIIYNATIRYRSILMRNLTIKKSIDKYRQQRENSKSIYLPLLGETYDLLTEGTLNQSFNFWFSYIYSLKPMSPIIELRPRTTNLYALASPKIGSKKQLPLTPLGESRTLGTTLSDKSLCLPMVTRSFEHFNLKDEVKDLRNVERNEIESSYMFNKIKLSSPYRISDHERDKFLLKKSAIRKSIHMGSLKQRYQAPEPQIDNSNPLEIIYEKRQKVLDIQVAKKPDAPKKKKRVIKLAEDLDFEPQIKVERMEIKKKKV